MLDKIGILPERAAEGFFREVIEMIGVLRDLCLMLLNVVQENQQKHR